MKVQNVHGAGNTIERSELVLFVKPEWQEMDRVKKETFSFLGSRGISLDLVNMYTMVVCELAKNGLKYGIFKRGQDLIVVTVVIVDDTFSVIVKNPIDEEVRVDLEELDRVLQWVRGFQDPFEAYLARQNEISLEPIEINKNGLGIVRIAYEGKSDIDFFISEDNTVSVSAVSKITQNEGATNGI